jgi:hemerythrin-like domain-containing protein
MNAIQMLEADHERVRALLKELDATTTRATRKRETLLEQIATEIRIHTTLEEEIFYPALKDAARTGEDEKMYFEALEEHRAAGDLVLPDLQNTAVDGDQFGGRAKVLKELIEHHADEEEEEMFPRARKLLKKARLDELGAAMAARKRELLASSGTTLKGVSARVISALTGGIGTGGRATHVTRKSTRKAPRKAPRKRGATPASRAARPRAAAAPLRGRAAASSTRRRARSPR